MCSQLSQWLDAVFGSAGSGNAIAFEHMLARAVVIYSVGLVIVRFGKNRLLGRTTGFDIVLAFILGSLLSRGINGAAPTVPTLAAAAVLVLLHWLVSFLTLRSERFARLVKGQRATLIRDGEVEAQTLRRKEVTMKDLAEALRLKAHEQDMGRVRHAYLERNGEISTVLFPPRVVEIDVRDGVQTVRVELAP